MNTEDWAKKGYMGGEETGFPEVIRTRSQREVLNKVAKTFPEYSEFFGATPSFVVPGLKKFIQQSELKKPYGSPNEEIPDYPEMEYNWQPPDIKIPTLEGAPVPPLPFPRTITFDIECDDELCPGQWTDVRIKSTEPMVNVEIVFPETGEEIEKITTDWKRARIKVPESRAGEEIQIRAEMRSAPEKVQGFSNTFLPVRDMKSYLCPSVYMTVRVEIVVGSGPVSKCFAWDFWREKVPDNIHLAVDDPTIVTFPCDSTDLIFFKDQLTPAPVGSWNGGRTGTFSFVAGGPNRNPLNCTNVAAPETVTTVLWNAAQFSNAHYTCAALLTQPCIPGVQNSRRDMNWDNVEIYIPSTTFGSGWFDYAAPGVSGTFKEVIGSVGVRTGLREVLQPACTFIVDSNVDWNIDFPFEHHGVTYGTHGFATTGGSTTELAYPILNGAVGAIATLIPAYSTWNFGKLVPEKPDFSTDIVMAIIWYDRDLGGGMEYYASVYGATAYSNIGLNYGATTGIALFGTRYAALESIIQTTLDDLLASFTPGYNITALNISAEFFYGTYCGTEKAGCI